MAKDGVRQRKPLHKENGGGGDGASSAKQSSPAPASSSAGMTCFNWFVVLFIIVGVSGGISFFIYQEMTLTNRALLRELQQMKKDSSSLVNFQKEAGGIREKLDGDLEGMKKKLDGVEKMQRKLQEDKNADGKKLEKLSDTVEDTQLEIENLLKVVQQSLKDVDGVKGEFEAFKTTQTSSGESKDTIRLKHLSEQLEVANTNIKYLSDEVLRMDKTSRERFDQLSSVQQEVIDLTAEKLITKSAIESIKSTVVGVREKVQNIQSGAGSSGAVTDDKKVEELEKRMAGEMERLSRELSETQENSAKWLQHSTNEMTENFQKSLEEIKQQFNEVKVQIKEPTHATENESLINSVASLDTKIRSFESAIEDLKQHLTVSDGKHDAREKSQIEQLTVMKRDVSSIMTHIRSAKERDDKMTAKVDALAGDVTSAGNELNGISTTTRILEERLGELQNDNKKLDNIVKGILGKESAVKE